MKPNWHPYNHSKGLSREEADEIAGSTMLVMIWNPRGYVESRGLEMYGDRVYIRSALGLEPNAIKYIAPMVEGPEHGLLELLDVCELEDGRRPDGDGGGPMSVINKYPLEDYTSQSVRMPVGAEILHIRELYLWALVDPSAPLVNRGIFLVPTGIAVDPDPNAKYIGTIHLYDGTVVVHAFDMGEEPEG